MFTMATDERVRSLLEGAGFASARIEDVPVRFEYSGIDDYVAVGRDTGGAFARAWDAASEEQQAAIKQRLVEAYAPFSVDGGYVVPGLALVAVAT
jgi:hypothetical protein